MTELKNDRFLKALAREPVDKTPIWIMRQAGRYLPEYRATRAKAGDFLTLCKTPELACEVTLQPLERFDLDAAILFSDILTIPDAMGLGLQFRENEGPVFEHPLRTIKAIKALATPDPQAELRYVMDATALIHSELSGRVPLIGFSGSPWTLATYMIEGQSSRDFRFSKNLLYQEPEAADLLLEKLATSVAQYLNAQISAGAQAVMIFDSWGGVLSPELYQRFSLAPIKKILAQLTSSVNGRSVPSIVFSKGVSHSIEEIAGSGCSAMGLDWTISLSEAFARTGGNIALQGNMDPCVLYADDAAIVAEARRILQDFPADCGHVFNLGHGIHPTVDPEKVRLLVDTVHAF
jgi:uroporphyrinogen decarboxylase